VNDTVGYPPGHDSLNTTVACSAGRNLGAGKSATRSLTRSCPGGCTPLSSISSPKCRLFSGLCSRQQDGSNDLSEAETDGCPYRDTCGRPRYCCHEYPKQDSPRGIGWVRAIGGMMVVGISLGRHWFVLFCRRTQKYCRVLFLRLQPAGSVIPVDVTFDTSQPDVPG
jgi:hypothetical protein